MYVTSCVGFRAGRLIGPVLSLSLVGLAGLTGINRVAEYRNHWSDVLAGQALGGAVAVFLVREPGLGQIGQRDWERWAGRPDKGTEGEWTGYTGAGPAVVFSSFTFIVSGSCCLCVANCASPSLRCWWT